MQRSFGTRSVIIIAFFCEMMMLCWNRNCQIDVIQVGARYEIEIHGCSRIGSEILDSICEYGKARMDIVHCWSVQCLIGGFDASGCEL